MKFVNLTSLDAQKIDKFYRENFSDGWNKEMLSSAYSGGHYFSIGLESDGELIGVIGYSLSVDDADIESIVVKNAFRRQGVASALFDLAILDIIKKDKKKIFLEVRESNAPAIKFYTKYGFTKVSVRKKYYFDGENAIVMVKDLGGELL